MNQIQQTNLLHIKNWITMGFHISHLFKQILHDNRNFILGIRYSSTILKLQQNFKLFFTLIQNFEYLQNYLIQAKNCFKITYMSTKLGILNVIHALNHFYSIDFYIGHWYPGSYSNLKKFVRSTYYSLTSRIHITGFPQILLLLNRDGIGSEEMLSEISLFNCWIFGITNVNVRIQKINFPILANNSLTHMAYFWALFWTLFLTTYNLMRTKFKPVKNLLQNSLYTKKISKF